MEYLVEHGDDIITNLKLIDAKTILTSNKEVFHLPHLPHSIVDPLFVETIFGSDPPNLDDDTIPTAPPTTPTACTEHPSSHDEENAATGTNTTNRSDESQANDSTHPPVDQRGLTSPEANPPSVMKEKSTISKSRPMKSNTPTKA